MAGSLNLITARPQRSDFRIGAAVMDRYARDPYGLWGAAVAREFSHVVAHVVLSNITATQYEGIPGVMMPGRSVVFGFDFFLRAK